MMPKFTDVTARFTKGVPMTVEEVSKVVGPEFAEAHKNPHPAVLKLREEMLGKKTARQRITWQRSAADLTGLYGFSKGIQRSAEAATRRLARHSLKTAKRIFAKDAEVVPFLQAHMKREDSKPAKVLLAALKEVGPKLASEMRGGLTSKTATEYGLYGFKAKTAELGLDACKEVRSTAGRITAELHQRHAADHGKFTGFYKEHSKQAKCSYAGMLLSCYPDASMKTASRGEAAQVHLSGKSQRWRLPENVRFKDRGTMSVNPDNGHVNGRSDVTHLGISSQEQFALIEEPGHIEDITLNPFEWRKFRDQASAIAVENGFTTEDVQFTFFLNEMQDALILGPSDFDVEGTTTISASWGNTSQLEEEVGFTATFSSTPMFQEAYDSLSDDDWDAGSQGPRRFGSYRQLTGGQLEWEG